VLIQLLLTHHEIQNIHQCCTRTDTMKCEVTNSNHVEHLHLQLELRKRMYLVQF
jgi:hypothetical protein